MHTPSALTVLLVELQTDASRPGPLKHVLEQADFEVLTAPVVSPLTADYLARLKQLSCGQRPALIVLSLDKQASGGDVPLDKLLDSFPSDVPVIVAAHDFEATQIHTFIEMGATDFITPPFTPASVLPRLWRLVRHSRLTSSVRGSLREQLGTQRVVLLGESPAFLEETRKLPLLARCDVTVMIWGETGTGKELVARTLHYLSPRHDRPFVPIDCSAIPPELAESELFGHERGAFTGAVTKTQGLIAAADQGTLFLDEVDGLSLSVQAKLLRFLQEMEYRPLGSNKIRSADVRVIAATNGDLQQRVRDGEFRKDLYYRLNVAQIRLPSLRQRHEDITLLARHFVAKYAARFKCPARQFSRDALTNMLMHPWPGNVRELENVVEAAVALCDGPLIGAGDLLFAAQESNANVSFREAKAQAISEFERNYLVRLLCACGGNVSEAARAAGKNRRAFWELICKHGIDVGEMRSTSGGGRERGESPRNAARLGARNFPAG